MTNTKYMIISIIGEHVAKFIVDDWSDVQRFMQENMHVEQTVMVHPVSNQEAS